MDRTTTHAEGIDPAALEIVGRTPGVLRALLAGLPEAVLRQPNEEGWSITDVVAHLVDVEGIAFVERITRMLEQDRPFIRSIDPPARLVAGGYAERSLEDLLAELERQRAEHVVWLSGLGPEQLARTGEHDEVGEIRVGEVAHQWAAHDLDHLRQVARMLQAHVSQWMGATRNFYDV
jgi:hypothetical protein